MSGSKKQALYNANWTHKYQCPKHIMTMGNNKVTRKNQTEIGILLTMQWW